MLSGKNFSIFRFWRQRKIANLVRQGIVPRGVSQAEIFEALKATRPKGTVEMFGFLSAKHHKISTGETVDLGLQSVKKVTLAFVKYLADGFCGSDAAARLDDFTWHGAGDGSAAEGSGDAALTNSIGTRVQGSQTHGASSNIYRSVKTFVASAVFTAIEHGIFESITGQVLLDRSILTTPPTLATGDEVEYTYDLTINTET